MNILVGTKDGGGTFLALVLEPGNVHKLEQKKPITLRIEDMFPDGIPRRLELGIFYSETPVADAKAVAALAEVTLDERAAVTKTKRPHCPECRSTIEQMGMMRPDTGPVSTLFCPICGCVLGFAPRQ